MKALLSLTFLLNYAILVLITYVYILLSFVHTILRNVLEGSLDELSRIIPAGTHVDRQRLYS